MSFSVLSERGMVDATVASLGVVEIFGFLGRGIAVGGDVSAAAAADLKLSRGDDDMNEGVLVS